MIRRNITPRKIGIRTTIHRALAMIIISCLLTYVSTAITKAQMNTYANRESWHVGTDVVPTALIDFGDLPIRNLDNNQF